MEPVDLKPAKYRPSPWCSFLFAKLGERMSVPCSSNLSCYRFWHIDLQMVSVDPYFLPMAVNARFLASVPLSEY